MEDCVYGELSEHLQNFNTPTETFLASKELTNNY